jgi:hypothetical protein
LLPIGQSEPARANSPTTDPARQKVYSWIRGELEQGRGADPEAAARLVLRLAAGDGDGVTGRHLSVHDDLDLLIARADTIRQDDLYTL